MIALHRGYTALFFKMKVANGTIEGSWAIDAAATPRPLGR